MEEKLDADNIQEKADRMAKLSVWEIYQPMVAGGSVKYFVFLKKMAPFW